MMTHAYLQMEVALVAVLGLLFLTSFFFKKRQGRPGVVSVMTYQSLGPKKGIAAVRVGKDLLILAVTPQDVKLLTTVNDQAPAGAGARDTVRDLTEKLRKLRTMKETLYAHN